MKSLAVFFLFFLPALCFQAPTTEAQNRYESEQIYLHALRRNARQGDTLRLQGLIKASDRQRTVPLSRYAYIELIGPADSVLVRQKVACNAQGVFEAALPTDYFWPDAVYYLQAYTRLMQNFNPATFPVVSVTLGNNDISGKEAASGTTESSDGQTNEAEENREIACAFYPEGGRWLPGVLQNLVFYLYDRQGRPVQADNLVLLNSRKDTLLHARTTRSGFGRLIFTPAADESYLLTGSPATASASPRSSASLPTSSFSDSSALSRPYAFPLPPVGEGTLLQARANRGRVSYRIHPSGPSPKTRFRLFLLHASGEWEEFPVPALKTEERNRQTIEGIIRLNPAAGERVSLFLTDDSIRLLSQRHLWIAGPSGPADTPALAWPDGPFRGGEPIAYSLSGLPPASTVFARLEKAEETKSRTPFSCQAVARLYFESALASSCPFPLQTDARRDGAALQEWDDWLCTARFVQWNPEEGLKGRFRYRYPFEDKLFFSGRVRRKTGKPLRGGLLIAYNTASNAVYEAGLDAEGRFTIGVDDFKEGTSFFLQAYDTKQGTDFYTYEIDEERYPPVYRPAYANNGAGGRQTKPEDAPAETVVAFSEETAPAAPAARPDPAGRTAQEAPALPAIRKGDGPDSYILPEITVKARLSEKKPAHEEKFYSFNFKDTRTIDDRHYLSLKEILEDLPGVRLRRNDPGGGKEEIAEWEGNEWGVFSSRGSGTLKSKGLPVLLDGKRESLDQLIHMSAREIASVEVLRPWQTLTYVTGAIDGAVLVRTREYQPEQLPPSKGIYYTPLGLSMADSLVVAAEPAPTATETAPRPDAAPLPDSSAINQPPASTFPPLTAPRSPGAYALWIDAVAPDGACFSFYRKIRVAPAGNEPAANEAGGNEATANDPTPADS